MALATLTKSGRAAIAAAIAARPLHLAWGIGLEEWDAMTDEELPSLVERTELFNEIGRRVSSWTGFAEPDEKGGIVVPTGTLPDGSVEVARYRQCEEPTPYLFFRINYDFADASNAVIRELGIFMDTETLADLPPGQMYFLPAELQNTGRLLAAQILRPSILRSPAVRQTIEFVLPL